SSPPPKPKLSSQDKREIKKLIPQVFKATDEAQKETLLKKIEAFDPIPKSAVSELRKKAFFSLLKAGPRLELKHDTSLVTSQGTGKLILSGVKKGKTQPLLIGLHGGGPGVGAGSTSEQKWQPAASKGCLCVFPTVLKKESTAWNREREEKYVLEIIEAVKRSCRVDTNRIYLVGHSMGGFGTWSIGGHYADIFAAISPNAGGIIVMRGGGRTPGGPGRTPQPPQHPRLFLSQHR
ncbi:MAG: hypothetical protein ACYTHM_17630, partial [Planctomycetota bacterium]